MTRRCKVHSTILAAVFFVCAPNRLSAMTAAQWQADLQSLVELESTHPNLFSHVSKQDFDAAVSDLNRKIPQFSDAQVTVAMMQLVARIGDAHTSLWSPFAFLSVRVRWFSDGWRDSSPWPPVQSCRMWPPASAQSSVRSAA